MKGAEAALPNAIDDARVDYVIGISPSSVVWANIGAGRDGVEWPQRSSWTRAGVPLPFIAYDVSHPTSQREAPSGSSLSGPSVCRALARSSSCHEHAQKS